MERFREDINRYRFETDTTWTALAEKAGVSPAMFTRLKKGSVVTLEAFAQLCASCRLNPIDYMPELQTAQEHETAKEHPMEETKRLSIDGKEFTIRDVDIRSGSAWANGPRISDAELPDGVSPERTGNGRNRPKDPWPHTPARSRTVYRPSTTCCKPSRTGIPTQTPTHGRP